MLLRALAASITLTAAAAAFAGSSASYTSFPQSVNAGGGSASSATYATSATIGQPFASGTLSTSASYQLKGGFWNEVASIVPIASLGGTSPIVFSDQTVDTASSPPVGLALSNVGSAALTFTISVTGANSTEFSVGGTCGSSLAPTASCQIDITFTPHDTGLRQALLSVATNDPANPTITRTLNGNGVAASGGFMLTVSKLGAGGGRITSSPAGIDCGATCSASYASAAVVTLTAIHNLTSLFGGWSGCDSVDASGHCVVTMSAAKGVSATFVSSGGWSVDVNGDGHPDLVWSNTANGSTYVWYMGGTPPALITDAFIAQIDPSWKIQGIADFDGDGHPDLVWRNTANGNCYVWYMNGTSFITDAFLFGLPPQWVIQGVADFNGDGHPDFLMRNTDPASGVGFAWYFNNATAIGSDFLFGIDPMWKVEQVGDLNGDGQPDLLFRNMTSGLAFAWYTQYSGVLSLAGSSPPIFSIDPAWEIAQLDDWNGDGQRDLLFRNANTGVVFVWYLNGTTLLPASDYVIQIDPSWEIVPRR